MNKLLLSACLAGNPVRYDGAGKALPHPQLQDMIITGRAVLFCPETAAGLPVPRDRAEIEQGDGNGVLDGYHQVITINGLDVTDAFVTGAYKALDLCQREAITIAILTEKSPSCGSTQTYDGQFSGTLTEGSGVTAALLRRHGIRVFNQHQVNEALALLNPDPENNHD